MVDTATVQALSDRLCGFDEGSSMPSDDDGLDVPSAALAEHGGEVVGVERTNPACLSVIPAGERLIVEMPGGGGLGDPLARDPAAVQRDVAMGYVSREAARDLYKVVVDAQGGVDHAATNAERA